MKTSAETKLNKTVKASILGALLFAGFTILVPIGDKYFGSGMAGQFWPETFWGLEWAIGLPAGLLLQVTGIDHTSFGPHLENMYYAVVVNAILGALFAFVMAGIWHFFLNEDFTNEK